MDRPRLVWLGALALVCGLVAWLLVRGAEQPDLPAGVTAAEVVPSERSSSPDEESALAAAAPPVAEDARAGVDPADSTSVRDIAEIPRRDARLRVVDRRDEPLAGIGVVQFEGWSTRHEYRTDATGWVTFPGARIPPGSSAVVVLPGGDSTPWLRTGVEPGGEYRMEISGIAHVEIEARPTRSGARAVLASVDAVVGHRAGGGVLAEHEVSPGGEPLRVALIADSGRLAAWLTQPGDQWGARVEFTVPPPGEVVRVLLEGGTAPIVLAGRAFDREARPIANAALDVRLHVPAPAELDASFIWLEGAPPYLRDVRGVATDGDGRFEVGLHAGWEGFAPFLFVARGGHDREAARVVLGPLRLGRTELDAVLFVAPPVLARGVVVDPEGEPVAGARVWIEAEEEYRGGTFGRIAHVARSDDTGAFTVRGHPLGGHVRLKAQAQGSAEVWVPGGGAPRFDHRLVLERDR